MTSILGTGSCLPECVVTNDDYTKTLDTSDEWIFSRTGIKSRHIAKTETITELALEAAKRALEAANTQPEELGLIVSACITPYNLCPSLSCELMARLGIACPAFDINAACSGFVYALKAADALRGGKKALVLGAEKLSSITDFTDRTTCVLFGDGAGACVLGGGPEDAGILCADIYAQPDVHGALYIPGMENPDPSHIHMNGPETFKFATRELERVVKDALAKTGYSKDDVRWFIPHQANARIVKSAAERLGVPLSRFYMNIDHIANTSSATIAIALDELARSGGLSRGDLIVLAAFGGGLTSGACVIKW